MRRWPQNALPPPHHHPAKVAVKLNVGGEVKNIKSC